MLNTDYQYDASDGAMFARLNDSGHYDIFFAEDGGAVTRIDHAASTGIYPVGAVLGTRYEHPAGIVLDHADVVRMGIEIEDS